MQDWHAKAVTAVVLDTRTGGILAMASAPGVPPRATAPATPDEWRLRAITDLYEPGSTFKLVTFMGALQEGVITPQTMFRVKDSITAYDRTIPDAHSHPVETVDGDADPRALVQRRHDHDRRGTACTRAQLQKWIHLTGFGHATGVDLPGEEPGKVLDDDKWYGTAILNVPIGEGIAVTPLQMAALYGSVANGGLWVQPHVDRLRSAARRPRAGRRSSSSRSTSPAELRDDVDGCRRPRRTAPASRRASPATASPARPARRRSTTPRTAPTAIRTVAKCQYQTSFVGFAPATHPRFVALVMVDEPKDAKGRTANLEGGDVAAPTFKDIAQGILQILRIAPDRPGELG